MAAAVVGSVARGDFNVWSDIDVVVVAEELPASAPARALALTEGAPAGIQPVAFTRTEFEEALRRRNPLALEAVDVGVALLGADFLRR